MATHAENMFHRPILQPLRLSGIPSRRHRLPISQKTQMCQPILKSFTLNSTYIDYLKYQVREIANIKISSAKKATCQSRGTWKTWPASRASRPCHVFQDVRLVISPSAE
jgi:hypothetical protein